MASPTAATRPPAVAGAFYPAEPARLADLVDRLLLASSGGPRLPAPWAIVVPHAGYVYSGGVAAAAYERVRRAATIRRVVVAGPAHFVPLDGAAVPVAATWSTPLGTVPIDGVLRELAVATGAVADDRPHGPEHSLEVQLPFLQRVVPEGLSILPLVVGDMLDEQVADLMGRLRDAADLLVVSTDLSHYHPDDVARRLDRQTVDAIVARNPQAIGLDAACGIFALRGVVELARRLNLPVTLLDRRTSADAGGDPYRVVGYAAVAIG
jgi:AmmeMemoRadiSam system protein B